MSKALKERMVEELSVEFKDVQDCFLVDSQNLKSDQTEAFRRQLSQQKVQLTVVKGAVAKRAFSQAGLTAAEPLLSGPTAVAVGADTVAAAKVLVEWASKKEGKISIKGGLLARRAITPAEVAALATLPDKKTMMAQVLATVLAPVSQIAGLLQATLAQPVYLAQGHMQKLESAGGAASADAPKS